MANHRFTNLRGRVYLVGRPTWGGAYMSKLEQCGFIDMTLDPTAEEVTLGAARIRYVDADGPHRYTGDAFVRQLAGTGILRRVVEFKYEVDIDDELKRKFDLLTIEFRKRGIEFVVRTDGTVYTRELEAKKMVLKYHNELASDRDEEILSTVRAKGEVTLRDLVAGLSSDELEQLRLVPAIWRLVAHRKIFVDFSENLDFSAKIKSEPVL